MRNDRNLSRFDRDSTIFVIDNLGVPPGANNYRVSRRQFGCPGDRAKSVSRIDRSASRMNLKSPHNWGSHCPN